MSSISPRDRATFILTRIADLGWDIPVEDADLANVVQEEIFNDRTGQAPHLRARLDRLEGENLALRQSLERTRNVLSTTREEVARARIHALRRAAHIATYDVTENGDAKEYPSVVGARIAERITQEYDR